VGRLATYIRTVQGGQFGYETADDNTYAIGEFVSAGVAYDRTDFSLAGNGNLYGSSASSPSAQDYSNLAKIYFGMSVGTGNMYALNGHLKSVVYIPRRISNAELQGMTS
jgi:hypothetical protein